MLNAFIKFAKSLLVLVIGFGLGWVACLFLQSSPDTDTKAEQIIEKAVAESTKDLKEELEKKDSELKEIKSDLKKKKTKSKADKTPDVASKDIYKEVVETIFYDIEGDFIMNNPDFKFYSARSCAPDKLITDELKFITHRDVDGKNASGFEVFISMSSQGPVYSTEKPYFNPAN